MFCNNREVMNPPIYFDFTKKEILQIQKEMIQTYDHFIQNIHIQFPHIKPDELFEQYLYVLQKYDYISDAILFLQHVSDKKEIRDLSIAFGQNWSNYISKIFSDPSLYKIFYILKKCSNMTKEKKKVIDYLLISFERNGIRLKEKEIEEMNWKKKELNKKEIEFNQNIYQCTDRLLLSKKECEGLSSDFLKTKWIKKMGKYSIGLSYPEEDEILKKCDIENTRKKYYYLYNNVAYPKNQKVLQDIIILRNQLSHMIGYKNEVDFVLSFDRIATEKKIFQLIHKLIPQLKKNGKKEYEELLKKFGRDEIYDYDMIYYMEKYRSEYMDIHSDKISEYFPTWKVIPKIFDIYGKLFQIQFHPLKPSSKYFWHPDVQLYTIHDSHKNELLGYLYLDLFPRNHKYNHAATFDLQSTYKKDGRRVIPVTAIVCNFTPSIGKKPALMTHGELKTFCHELGHALHNLLSQVEYASLSGTKTELDFVETVSQCFENWCWEKSFLIKISEHYQTKQKITDDELEPLLKSRYWNIHIHYLIQILYILYDITLHKKIKPTLTEIHQIWFDIAKKLLPFPLSASHIHPMCRFGHLIGYEVSYYSYLWSIIYAYDIFSVFKKKGIDDKKSGLRFRKEILEKGSSDSGKKLLKNFLQRNPSSKSFEKIFD